MSSTHNRLRSFKCYKFITRVWSNAQYCDHNQDWISIKRHICGWLTGFPGGAGGKELACQWRSSKRCGFNSWVRKIPWQRAWQPTPVVLPGESHGQRSLVGYSPWGHRVGHDWSDLAQHSTQLIHVDVCQKPSQYCKVTVHQSKIKQNFLKRK